MKIKCPECNNAVPPEQINMSTDLAFCPVCNETFSISENVEPEVDQRILEKTPKGTWFRQEVDHLVLGASTRSKIAFFLIPFMCFWSGISMTGIYGSQIMNGKFDLGQSLFGLPFLIGTIVIGMITIMSIWGKVEVLIGRESLVFLGVGKLGWKRKFDWAGVERVYEDMSSIQSNGRNLMVIVLEGAKALKFGSNLNDEKRTFVLEALRYLKSKGRR